MKLHQIIARWCGYHLIRIKKNNLTLEGHLLNLFAALGINCVIDVGANRGQYGEMLRRIGFRGRIVSFEPVSSSFEELQRCARQRSDWQVQQCGLGSQTGELMINVAPVSQLSSFRTPSAFFRERFEAIGAFEQTETVAVRRLDDVFAEAVAGIVAPRVFLKMDTQGYDLEVLAGAPHSLAQVVGLQSELSVVALYEGMPDCVASLAALRELGFQPTGFFPVSREKHGLGLVEFDCVMQRSPRGASSAVSAWASRNRK
jgi:FkbM family methyltransferase